MDRFFYRLFRNIDSFYFPILIGAMVASLLPFLTGELGEIDQNKERILFVVITVGAVMAVVMVKFLSGSSLSSSSSRDEMYRYEIDHLRDEIKTRFAKQESPISENEETILAEEIMKRIKSEINSDYLADLKKSIQESEYRLDIFKRGKSTLERIYKEIDALGRRGTVNLVLGVITALSGVVALSFFVLANENLHSSLSSFVMDFFPRLSIVLIIEVFSYFFLRLYKSSLSEIKYFQNEATNIEHSFVALEAAIEINDKDLVEKCINQFLSVERNPLMNKDQTTREIVSESSIVNSTPVSPDYLIKIIEALRGNEKS